MPMVLMSGWIAADSLHADIKPYLPGQKLPSFYGGP